MKNPIFAEGAGYVRGRFVPIAEAVLPVTDWGFTRSDVVYDVVHVFKGGFFRLADHLDRFERSMAQRRIRPPEDRAAIEAILHRCVALTGLADAYVAMVASRGRPRVAGSRRPADCENHLIAYALPWIDVVPKDVQARGAHVWVASTPRVPDASVDPTVKNYQWNDLTSGLLEAHDADFDTAVLCDTQGFLTEGPGFNIFVVKDGR
jgi:branched-chain amino acid aminotransferase